MLEILANKSSSIYFSVQLSSAEQYYNSVPIPIKCNELMLHYILMYSIVYAKPIYVCIAVQAW